MSRRSERAKHTGEFFTPALLVNEMLDQLPNTIWEPGRTFCDPAAGNGNMLVEVLRRKLRLKHDSMGALKSIFGLDIMLDNIRECRARLLRITKDEFGIKITMEHVKAVLDNIRCVNRKRRGSLGYDFEFKKYCHKKSDYHTWYNWAQSGFCKGRWEDLPVEEEFSAMYIRGKGREIFA